ncbi:MAG: hypothetical protein KBG15_00785 [Kofleriaceae bacterium]|nr:hypothetical protein [Kofleriaceae bacterium]
MAGAQYSIVSRFAPSTTGQAHPGTLLSALLVWLDVRTLGGRALLRLENLDHTRCKTLWSTQMIESLAWLGLTWDETITQSENRTNHEATIDQLAGLGRLYACTCSRTDLHGGRRAPDGGWAYDNRCRNHSLTIAGWRTCPAVVRVRLDDTLVTCIDESGLDLSQTPAIAMGDPIVRRRDGVIAYQLAVVADDIAAGVTRVVRGRDIAASTATQVALYRLLGHQPPQYRHHLLLLEARSDEHGTQPKLAKLHGSVPFDLLQKRYNAATLLGQLAFAAGLAQTPAATSATALLSGFAWHRVRQPDLVTRWDPGFGLHFDPSSST